MSRGTARPGGASGGPGQTPGAGPPFRLYGAVGPNWTGVRALLRRELRRYRKEAAETLLAPAFSTVVYIAVFVLALGPDHRSDEGRSVLDFLVPGLVMFAALHRAAETTAFSILFQKIEHTLSDILSAPLSAGETCAAFVLAGLFSGLATGGVVLAAAQVLRPLPPADPVAALLFAAGGSLMLSLWGMLVGIWAERWDHMAAAFGFVLVPLAYLSGVFAPIDTLPPILQAAMRVNPLHYAIDGFRGAFLGAGTEPAWRCAAVVAGTSFGLWVLVDRLLRRGWRLKG
ncbi:MAG TPA: ABC transporter permease [Azospirillaceae bacterium]|nr:ABC transporter permease [Azospirillaceae bacterium]